MVKIFIDPGHGGTDSGASANGLLEKNITLQIALLLRDMLISEYDGVSVRLSRSTDQSVTLSQRTNAANSWGQTISCLFILMLAGAQGLKAMCILAFQHRPPRIAMPFMMKLSARLILRTAARKLRTSTFFEKLLCPLF